ncbi:MAG TPA: hypothetical protein VH682_15415 [Gemmataceae bacterium]|jgi:hypothetical protein
MTRSVSEIIPSLTPDTWRQETGFSPEIEAANQRLFDESASDADRIAVVNEWIQKHQPCLFGRIAAKNGFLSYCVLSDADLKSPDHLIKDKIQAARLEWTRDGDRHREGKHDRRQKENAGGGEVRAISPSWGPYPS